MRGLRHHKKAMAAGLATLGTVIGIVTIVVLPALATPTGAAIPPPSYAKGITPIDVATGGQSNDCAVFYSNSWSGSQYRIANPKSGTYMTTVNGTAVTFTLTIDPPEPIPGTTTTEPASSAGQTYVSFSSTGAVIADVGIKGGTDEARYNYTGLATPPGATNPNYGFGVSGDSYLHAPAQSTVSSTDLTPTKLYTVSNLTFCFNLAVTFSGTVYNDANQNGQYDDGTRNQQAGWTVNLYNTPPTGTQTPVATTTSGADGSYSFTVPQSSASTYRVCEAPPSAQPGPWAQSQPYTSSTLTPASCKGSGELSKGYSLPATKSATDDFGNVQAVNEPSPCPPQTPFGIGTTYQIQLAACKPGQTFVFSFIPAVIDGNPNNTPPTVSVFVGDETQPLVPLVEKIVLPFLIQTPQPVVTLQYDDTFPFSLASAVPMPFCNLDPRTTGSEFGLQAAYASSAGASSVLPGTATSCLIQQTQSSTRLDPVNHPDQGTYTAYVYSELDGLRAFGP